MMGRREWAFFAAVACAALSGCASDPAAERADQVERQRRRSEGVALAHQWQYAYAPEWASNAPMPVRVVSSGYSGYVASTTSGPPTAARYVPPAPPVYATTSAPVYVTTVRTPVHVAPAQRTTYAPQPTVTYVSQPSVTYPATWTVAPAPRAGTVAPFVQTADRVQRIRDLDARIDAAATRIAALRVQTVRSSRYDERIHWLESVRDAARQDVTALRDGLPRSPTFDEAESRVRTLEDYVDSEGRAISEGR
jgi:hypothetical protein